MKKLVEEDKAEMIQRRKTPGRAWTREDFLDRQVSILRESFDDTEAIANFFREIYPLKEYYPRNWEPHELGYKPDPHCLFFDRGPFSDRETNPYQAYHFDFYDYAPGDWVSINDLKKEENE
jgi:hypothetical protein